MSELSLRDHVILVVEDEYLLATDLCAELAEQGAVVIGPAATLEKAMHLLHAAVRIDAAVLDVNLRGDPVFPLADQLIARDLPFVFTTGYDASVIPERFAAIGRCEKPIEIANVVAELTRAAHA